MSFDRAVIQQGNLTKKEAEETPNAFAKNGGAAMVQPTGQLDKRVANWNSRFSQSNQGMQFNQAKMMMGGQAK